MFALHVLQKYRGCSTDSSSHLLSNDLEECSLSKKKAFFSGTQQFSQPLKGGGGGLHPFVKLMARAEPKIAKGSNNVFNRGWQLL